jgi:two-component system sensor histidine kinase VicK
MLDSILLPLHFTVEFTGFVVFAGAVFLIAFRPSVVPAGRFGRFGAALGFATLAGAQAAHGAGFVETDGDAQLIGARALGLLLIAIGVARAGSPWSYPGVAGAAVRIRESLSLAPVTAALILVLVALSRARKGIATFRRLALGAFLIGVSEGLTGVFPAAEVGTASVDPLVHVAHIAKLLGYAAIAAWLWSSIRSSVRSRFVAAFATLLLAVVLALSSTLTGVISSNVETEELNRLETQLDNAHRSIEGQVGELSNTAQIIATSPTVRSSFAARGELSGLARNIARNGVFQLDFVVLATPEGELLAWFGDGPTVTDRRGRQKETGARALGLSVIGSAVFKEATSSSPDVGPVAASIVSFRDDALATTAAAEVPGRRAGSDAAGVVVVGRYLDALTVEAITNSFKPARASIVHSDTIIATALPARTPVRALLPRSTWRSLSAESIQSAEQELGGRTYFSAFAPLVNAADAPIAALVLSTPADIITATRRADVTRSLFLVALGVGSVALLLAWLSGRRITRPIQDLTQAANAVREGDLSAKARVTGEDEVGQLGTTFNEMTAALIGMTDNLRDAARQERELRARIETIMQSMADGLVAVDPDRTVFAFNAAAEELTGVTTDDAVDKPLDDVLDVRDANGEKLALSVGDQVTGSVGGAYLMRREGPPLPVAVTSAVIRDVDGSAAGAVVVVRDVSREHEVERMKSDFLSNISHELRTPLTPIKGYAELLATRDLPADKSKRFATGIRESTERLERIVELLVDFAALEAGRLSPRARPVELGSLIEEIEQKWQGRSTKHELVVETGTSLPSVSGDERLLRRSLEEILDNAVKFSPDGGTIRITARESADGSAVELLVSDEGIGIPTEDLPHVFADFHQVDSSETRTYGGLGLGLAFVQRIVEAHRGEVEVVSELRHGTTLTIRLPAGRSQAAS